MKISFCTTCMGRLDHLKQTYLRNIESTSDYSNREFILLNYNSKDELHDWVTNNLDSYRKQGLVKYLFTLEPEHYISTHDKNIAHKNSSGDILINLDADVFIHPGICQHIIETMSNKNVIMVSHTLDADGNNGGSGKIAIRREHFFGINGYDESIRCGLQR